MIIKENGAISLRVVQGEYLGAAGGLKGRKERDVILFQLKTS